MEKCEVCLGLFHRVVVTILQKDVLQKKKKAQEDEG